MLRFAGDDLPHLSAFLWELRQQLEADGLSASIGITQRSGNYDADLENIESKVRCRKNAKQGSISLVALPFIAPCRIQPHLAANHWLPSLKERALRSWQSKLREDQHDRQKREPIWGLNLGAKQLPREFSDLVTSDSDSYLAIIKADVDGLGRLLAGLQFESLAAARNLTPDEAGREFSERLTACVRDAVEEALTRFAGGLASRYPFLPLIVAGDDLLIVSQRTIALQLADQIGHRYQANAARDPFLTEARQLARVEEPLTLSFGVLFAQQGFPFDAAFELAEELIRGAKAKRKTLPQKEGCIDYYWLASSGRETVTESRRRGEHYADPAAGEFRLFTRPWPLSQLDHALRAAEMLREFPRRKLKQLDSILRLGDSFSGLAYRSWWLRLDAKEQQAFRDADHAIRGAEPPAADAPELWRGTPNAENWFLELAQLTEIIND